MNVGCALPWLVSSLDVLHLLRLPVTRIYSLPLKLIQCFLFHVAKISSQCWTWGPLYHKTAQIYWRICKPWAFLFLLHPPPLPTQCKNIPRYYAGRKPLQVSSWTKYCQGPVDPLPLKMLYINCLSRGCLVASPQGSILRRIPLRRGFMLSEGLDWVIRRDLFAGTSQSSAAFIVSRGKMV